MSNNQAQTLTIAYDAKRAFMNYRGLGNYSRNLLSQMAQYYSDVHYILCTPKDKGNYTWLEEKPFEKIMPNGLWTLSPSLWRRYGIPSSLRDRQIDIYHGLSQELPEGIERLGCKTIVTMHDAIFMRYPELYSATYRRSFIRRNQSACERADLIIAISEQTKRDYMEFFGVPENRIRVVYQGCNELYWNPVADNEMQYVRSVYHLPETYVLSVGALETRKNQLRLIEGVAATRTNLPLVLVGHGNEQYKQLLYAHAKRHHVTLQLIENAGQQDMPAIYRMAAVFVYPSLFEGFGIPILEAARSEVPIIASAGTCFEEIAGDGALYVSPTNSEAIGDAISKTIGDPKNTRHRVALSLSNTEKFHAERIAHTMMHVYQSLR